MPPVPVPRAAAMLVPIRSAATTARFFFLVGKFPLWIDSLFYLFFFEEC